MNKAAKFFFGGIARIAAFAAVAAACGSAFADGAIRSIDAVATDQHTFPNLDDQVRVGETVKFDILLFNKRASGQSRHPDESVTNSWVIVHSGSGDAAYDAVNNPLKLGVIVNGKLRPADIELKPHETYPHIYTVMHVTYRAQAGDMAMPLKLADSTGSAAPDSSSVTYYLFNSRSWKIVDESNGEEIQFCFGNDGEPDDTDGTLPLPETRDYNLSQAGIYINTVGFDDYYEEGETWRKVYRGMTETFTRRLPEIVVPGGTAAENAGTTVYLWVKDTNCVTLATDGQAVKWYGDGADAHLAYPVSLLPGQTNVPFRLRGVTAGTETEIYLSAFPTNMHDGAGNLIENFTTRKVSCIASPDPFIRFTLNNSDSAATVTAGSDYNTPKARLTVELSEPYTDAVTVKLNPAVKTSADDVFADSILGISLNSEAANYRDTVAEVTIPAGLTSATVNIFALGATAETQSYGISFTPSVEGAGPASFYKGEKRACILYVNDSVPAIADPAADATIPQTFTQGVKGDVTVSVTDSYSDANKGGWTVSYRDIDNPDIYDSLTGLAPRFNSTTGQAELTVPLELYTMDVSHVAIKVTDPNGNVSAEVPFFANVVAPKTVKLIVGDDDQNFGNYLEGDVKMLRVQLSQKYTKGTLYAWIEGANDATRAAIAAGLVTSDAFAARYLVIPNTGVDSTTGNIAITFKDGAAATSDLQFRVVLTKTDSRTGEVCTDYIPLVFYANVGNLSPMVTKVRVNGGGEVAANGGISDASAAKDVAARFTISGLYEPGEVDRTNIVARWTVRDGRPGAYFYKELFTTGSISDIVCEYTYNVGDVTQKVSVAVQDKDMPGSVQEWSDEFEFWLTVTDVPKVTLVPYRSGTFGAELVADNTYFETEQGSRAWIDVSLSNIADVPLNVVLSVTPLSATEPGTLGLSMIDVQFPSGTLTRRVTLAELDGTRGSGNRGFQVSAAVTNTTMNTAYGKPWNEFFSESEPLQLTILNVEPKIISPIATAVTNRDVSAGIPFNIDWQIGDVSSDLTNGMRIVWTSGGRRTEFKGDDLEFGTFTNTFDVSLSGLQTVTMQVWDKDGGTTNRVWYYYLDPSKKVYLYPYGPHASSNSKYSGYPGLGRGLVFANGKSPVINAFRQMWNYDVRSSSSSLYAMGYSVGDVDNGTLNNGNDWAINPNGGSAVNGAGVPTAPFYTYDGKFRRGGNATYDSFFYCWVDHTDAAAPVYHVPHPAKSNTFQPQLPEYQEGSLSYEDKIYEAIFSREWRPLDNCGDINQDGVPDGYHQLYWPTQNTDAGAAGGGEDEVADTDEVWWRNDDEDYLPGDVTAGQPLVPGLTNSWVNSDRKFEARREIRGFGDGLNSAGEGSAWGRPQSVDPLFGDFDENERLAYEIATNANPAAAGVWHAERPSNPLLADTDGDGLPDGYEYWYWYYARAGWLDDNGDHHFLTGERYVPTRPEKGSPITPAQIMAAFDPVVAYRGAASRDLDNDGIPDLVELELGTNPIHWDTDSDGLPDGWEQFRGTDPLKSDAGANPDGDMMAYAAVSMKVFSTIVDGTAENYAITETEGDETRVEMNVEAAQGWRIVPLTPRGNTQLINGRDVRVDDFVSDTEPETFVSSSGKIVLKTAIGEAHLFVPYEDGGVFRGAPARLEAGTVLESAPEEIEWSRTTVKITDATEGREATEDDPGEPAVDSESKTADQRYFKIWEYGKTATFAMAGEAKFEGEREVFVHSHAEKFDAGTTRVGLMHWQVYQQFGFDPRTAWCWTWTPTTPAVNPRWLANNMTATLQTPQRYLIDTFSPAPVSTRTAFGAPVNTRPYSNRDEFLLQQFLYNTGSVPGGALQQTARLTFTGYVWPSYSTVPIGEEEGQNEEGDTIYKGGDSDADGVPDGWELYVMAGPNSTTNRLAGVVFTEPDMSLAAQGYLPTVLPRGSGAYEFAPRNVRYNRPGKMMFLAPQFNPEVGTPSMSPLVANAQSTVLTDMEPGGDGDGLSEAGEFSATDVTALFGSSSSVHTRCSDADAEWLNKFWPTDPWNADTDGDGLTDLAERDNIYGPPSDNGEICIAGGGMNPNSVDTDLDGLPDRWENQYAGTVGAATKVDASGATNTTQEVSGGMDATVPDAYTWDVSRDCDYDHDGLQNWQEYMTCALRCFRYDDLDSPWSIMSERDYRDENGFVVTQLMYAAAHEAVGGLSPNILPDQFDWGLAYFAPAPHGFDMAMGLMYMWHDGPQHNGFGRKIDGSGLRLTPGTPRNFPSTYVGCSPRDRDSDGDAMDDYWELFHGLNPLLGAPGEGSGGAKDLIAEAFSQKINALDNPWTKNDASYWDAIQTENFGRGFDRMGRNIAEAKGDNKPWDFTTYLWMNGSVGADPDGDDIRNQQEAVMPNMQAQSTWLHTDPSPLWMTDTSYTNSLTYRYYKTIERPGFTVFDMREGTVERIETVTYVTNIVETEFGMSTNIVENHGWTVVTNFPADEIVVTREDIETQIVTNWNITVTPVVEQIHVEWPQGSGVWFDGTVTRYVETTNGFETVVNTVTNTIDTAIPATVPAYVLNYWGASKGYLFAFEENEGFDTDNDGLSDATEIAANVTGATDPQNFDDPVRRQAMYFPGAYSAMESRTNPQHGLDSEMFFHQFTVELWAMPEDVSREQTLIERSTVYPGAHTQDDRYLRRNFQLGITAEGLWFAAYDSKGTGSDGGGTTRITGTQAEAGKWAHLAMSFDGERLRLYVNGRMVKSLSSNVQPANGVEAVTVGDGGELAGYSYVGAHAIILGASAVQPEALSIEKARPTWLAYDRFYKGYIDEVRVWDGARTSTEIMDAMGVRMTKELALANRMEIYNALVKENRVRYKTSATESLGELPPELVYHYSFDSIFGATGPEYVALAPYGFSWSESAGVRNRSGWSRPEGWTSTWWDELPVKSTVYVDYAYLTWAQNTMTHLPLFDGGTRDSRFWSRYYAGVTPSGSAGLSSYAFKQTAEPYGWYNPVAISTDHPRQYTTSDLIGMANPDYAHLHRFTVRSEFTDGTDLLPLGGVYARTVESMWDENGPASLWTATGRDDNQNGLPDWWEDYVRSAGDVYTDLPDVFAATAKIVRDGQEMTLAEAYMRDLAAGATEEYPEGRPDLVQYADTDADGLPDWWELLYGMTGETALDDNDNDQLSNFAEYLIAEAFSKYGFPLVKPDAMASFGQTVPDYFLKVGRLYLGEMFADHDFIEDWWEDAQTVTYTSRFHYDATQDYDDDGWSNFSEARYDMQVKPVTAMLRGHYDSDANYVRDFPQPTLHVNLDYNGSRKRAAENAGIVIEASRDPFFATGAEAVFVASNATSSASGGDKSYRNIGHWRIGSAVGTLAPGNVDFKELELQIAKSSTSGVYCWTWADCENQEAHGHPTDTQYEFGTYEEYIDAKLRCDKLRLVTGESSWYPVDNLSIGANITETVALLNWADKGTVGTVDLQTGSFDLDLSLLAGATGNAAAEDESEVVHIENSRIRFAYKVNRSVGLPRTVHLEGAVSGYLREGTNYFRAFADIDGDGSWTPGEPYGCATPYGYDVSWRETTLSVSLSDTSPSLPRFDINGAVAANDSDSLRALNDRDSVGHVAFPNQGTTSVGTNMPPAGSTVRVRIVRTKINDIYTVYTGSNGSTILGSVEGVVYDGTMNLSQHPVLAEGDLLAQGIHDLDWGTLYQNWTDTTTGLHQTPASFSIVTNVMYRITIGDDTDSNFETNNILARVFRNGFEAGAVGGQTPCEPVSPAGIITSGRPTFRWRHENTMGKAYPAFRLRVWNAAGGGTPVYDSGVQRAPARTQDGEYVWQAPLYVGSPTATGHIFSTTNNYQWSVSMLDAKFTTPNTTETRRAFRVNTSGNLAGQSDHGTIQCRVKYFGPATVSGGFGPARIIRVQAFTTPDFSGYPVSESWVDVPAGIDSAVEMPVNAKIIGIPPGTYYIRAFIDTDGDTQRASWESWGYANYVGTTRKQVYDSRPFRLELGSNEKPVADIYIEDVDTDNDGYPDVWEYENATAATRADGTFLSQRGPASGPTYYTQVNTNLVATLRAYDIAGYTEFLTFALAANGSSDTDGDGLNDFAELVLGTDPQDSEGAKASGLSVSLDSISSPVRVGFKVEAGEVSNTSSARALAASGRLMYSPSAIEAAGSAPASVKWTLEYTPSLDKPDWTPVAEGTVWLTPEKTAADVAGEARKAANFSEKSGFYRVILK